MNSFVCTVKYFSITAGIDYSTISDTLDWHENSDVLQCIRLPIVNDECVEDKEETFRVSLSTMDDCVEFSSNNYTIITIEDDDCKL